MAVVFEASCRKIGFLLSAGVLAAGLIAGCTVIEGGTASGDRPDKDQTRFTTDAAAAAVLANDAFETGSTALIAAANFPLPLPSPRRREPVQVASIDPSAGVSALSSSSRPDLRALAGVYLDFGSTLASIEGNRLKTPGDVRKAIAALRISEPDDLAEGWYGSRAMIAAQDPVFAQGVRDDVRVHGKAAVLAALEADEDYILQISGVSSATAAVAVAIRNESEHLAALSARFIDTAYRFQKQKWGMTTPMPAPGAPAGVKTAAAATQSVIGRARDILASLSPIGTAQAYSPRVMNRILTLAAYQVVEGSMTSARDQDARTATGRCLNWARLNLDQCVAAAHFPSEEAWCTGKHALKDVGNCWAEALPPSLSATSTP
ncbi:MAG: hypothetical protein K9G30_07130 [Parvibaculum sp.]|nr:hypothetical protein [Parvibaculum sp.]